MLENRRVLDAFFRGYYEEGTRYAAFNLSNNRIACVVSNEMTLRWPSWIPAGFEMPKVFSRRVEYQTHDIHVRFLLDSIGDCISIFFGIAECKNRELWRPRARVHFFGSHEILLVYPGPPGRGAVERTFSKENLSCPPQELFYVCFHIVARLCGLESIGLWPPDSKKQKSGGGRRADCCRRHPFTPSHNPHSQRSCRRITAPMRVRESSSFPTGTNSVPIRKRSRNPPGPEAFSRIITIGVVCRAGSRCGKVAS